jgi:hypothetical protein
VATKSRQKGGAPSKATSFGSQSPLIPAKKVIAGISKFHDELRERSRQELAIRRQADREAATAMSPLLKMMKQDKDSVAAMERRRKLLASRRNTRAPFPKFKGKLERQVRVGSILTVEVPPYDFDWGDHSADDGPTTWGTYVASKDEARLNVTTYAGSGGAGWASAGMGKYFSPAGRDTTYVRIGLYAPYDYNWSDDSTWETAHSDGFIGVLVQSWDRFGNNFQTDVDRRIPLWSDGTSWFESHSDNGDGYYPSDTYFWAWSNRVYAVWAWCGASCDGSSGSVAYSKAYDSLSVSMPFMVFEQYT